MGRHPAFVALIALAIVLTQFPVSAVAAVTGPVTSPAIIRSEGFEALPYASDLTIEPVDLLPPATAYWGRITQRAYTGSYGLWCAGSVPGSPATSGWTAFGGLYPDFAYGVAVFDLPQLSGYYSATLGYRYLMPSIGAADADSFNVMWGPDGSSWDAHPDRPVTATWASESWDLSAPSNEYNLSRKAGVARFGFVDLVEGFGESPSTGEGATIDDVVFSGYKFGPVRSFSASVVSGKGRLTWQKPWRSTEATTAEERSVAYRVWRAPDTLPYAWTELTSSRQTATSFDDPAGLTGVYRYAVQAWDPGTGTGYGVEASAVVTLSSGVNYTLKYAAGPNGTLSGTTSQTVISGGSGTQVTANAATGYHFVNWSDTSTANPRTDTNVTANVNVTANFAINTYTLTYSAGAGGFIDGTSPQTVNYGGSGSAVTAVALTGYHFVNWSDASTANPRTDTNVIANKSVTANFAPGTTPPTPVYRFYNVRTGVHFYTASETEKANVIATLGAVYRYEGVAYYLNTANPDNDTPLYRFYNFKKGVHFYTASEAEKNNVVATLSSTYRLEGIAYNVCATPVTGATSVYRFLNFKQGVHFYTASEAEKNNVVATLSSTYRLEGVGYYLAP